MEIKWEKQGLIFQPNRELYWQQSHAALPTKLDLGGGRYRLYFSSRDSSSRAHIGYFEINLNNLKITSTSREPIMSPGAWGLFDDHGVQACSIVKADNGDLYMYYLGWNPCMTSPLFYTSIGLAISKDNGLSFEKYSSAPIMQRSHFDPWMVSGGTVMRRDNNWIMYYLSGFKFDFGTEPPTSWYDIKIAKSSDGVNWFRDGRVALPLEAGETNISRMTIVECDGLYNAWFPVKSVGQGYRCGAALSENGIDWQRMDHLGLPQSTTGWDSQAVDKMEVIHYEKKFFMFYNGNKFGLDGIGLAIGHEE